MSNLSIPKFSDSEPDHIYLLRTACITGDVACVASAVGAGLPMVAQFDPLGYELVHHAAASCSVPVLDLLLSSGASVASRTAHGQTPLHLAAQGDAPDVIARLVGAGADLNARDNDGITPLAAAAAAGAGAGTAALLALGADATVADHHGWTALHYAVLACSVPAATALLRAAPTLATVGDLSGRTVLMLTATAQSTAIAAAAPVGHSVHHKSNIVLDVLRQILRILRDTVPALAAALAAADRDGSTALHYAVVYGADFAVAELLAAADVVAAAGEPVDLILNARSVAGFTPLAAAVLGREAVIAGRIVEHPAVNVGVNVGIANEFGSLLHCAVLRSDAETVALVAAAAIARDAGVNLGEIERSLLARAAGDNEDDTAAAAQPPARTLGQLQRRRDARGRTPLHLAVLKGDMVVWRALLAAGQLDLDARDSRGLTALGLAALVRAEEMGSELLRLGAQADVAAFKDITPAHTAAAVGAHRLLTEILAAAPATANAARAGGVRPLHDAAAAGAGAAECVAALLAAGAEPTLPDARGVLPLHVASALGATPLVTALVAAAPTTAAAELGPAFDGALLETAAPLELAARARALGALAALAPSTGLAAGGGRELAALATGWADGEVDDFLGDIGADAIWRGLHEPATGAHDQHLFSEGCGCSDGHEDDDLIDVIKDQDLLDDKHNQSFAAPLPASPACARVPHVAPSAPLRPPLRPAPAPEDVLPASVAAVFAAALADGDAAAVADAVAAVEALLEEVGTSRDGFREEQTTTAQAGVAGAGAGAGAATEPSSPRAESGRRGLFGRRTPVPTPAPTPAPALTRPDLPIRHETPRELLAHASCVTQSPSLAVHCAELLRLHAVATGATLSTTLGAGRGTVAHLAAASPSAPLPLLAWLAARCDVGVTDGAGRTVLHATAAAAGLSHVGVAARMTLLVKAGADALAADDNDIPAVYLAPLAAATIVAAAAPAAAAEAVAAAARRPAAVFARSPDHGSLLYCPVQPERVLIRESTVDAAIASLQRQMVPIDLSERPRTLEQLRARPVWAYDAESPACAECLVEFTLKRRRHHCRVCGLIYCQRCMGTERPAPHLGYTRPVPCCRFCADVILRAAEGGV